MDVKINNNYFVLNTRMENLRYFLTRGHFFGLLYDRITWHWFPRLNIVPGFPQTVDIETSLSCQLRCPMCTREQMPDHLKRGIMSMDLFAKIINECARHSVFSIKLSWRGEPTLNPHLVDMVRLAKDKGIRDVAFLTNGGLVNRDYAEALCAAGLDWISFSIDGRGETYERIRRPITFEHVVSAVEAVGQARRRRNSTKPLIRIQTISSVVENDPGYFDFWKPRCDRISVIAEQHREDPTRIVHDPAYICQSPFQRVFVTHDGQVVPCHGDYFLLNVMGNVAEQSIADIWNSPRFKTFRADMQACRRLDYECCRICPDGGKYEGSSVLVEGREVPIIRYLDKTPANKQD